VTAGERGDLDRALVAAGRARLLLPGTDEPETLEPALDVDLGFSPLTNTLPIRRLGLLGAAPGTSSTITAAWVLVPALTVVAARQTYTVLGGGSDPVRQRHVHHRVDGRCGRVRRRLPGTGHPTHGTGVGSGG
jgi:hypothetical protein